MCGTGHTIMCSSLGRTNSLSLIFPQAPIVLWVGMRLCGFITFQFGLFFVVNLVKHMFEWSCW